MQPVLYHPMWWKDEIARRHLLIRILGPSRNYMKMMSFWWFFSSLFSSTFKVISKLFQDPTVVHAEIWDRTALLIHMHVSLTECGPVCGVNRLNVSHNHSVRWGERRPTPSAAGWRVDKAACGDESGNGRRLRRQSHWCQKCPWILAAVLCIQETLAARLIFLLFLTFENVRFLNLAHF